MHVSIEHAHVVTITKAVFTLVIIPTCTIIRTVMIVVSVTTIMSLSQAVVSRRVEHCGYSACLSETYVMDVFACLHPGCCNDCH